MNKKRGYPFCFLADYFCDYHKITDNTPYEILEIDAKELFTANRIDLAAKYNYIESMETGENIEFARELYKRHIEAFTDGTVREAGNGEKNSMDCYFDQFNQLIKNIKQNGFDSKISFIPVGNHNELFDGAHRTACAAYFGGKVKIVKFPHLSVCYNYNFFRKRLLEEVYIEYMAEKMCSIKEDIRCVCIWPSASVKKNLQEMKKRLNDANMPIVYSKKIHVNFEEFKEIIAAIYKEEPWVGSKWNRFNGVNKKAKWCYGKGDTLVFYFVQCKKVEELIKLKEKVRKTFELEKHSVHTTDTKEQTISLFHMLIRKKNAQNTRKTTMYKKSIRIVGREIRHFYAVCIHIVKRIIGKPV